MFSPHVQLTHAPHLWLNKLYLLLKQRKMEFLSLTGNREFDLLRLADDGGERVIQFSLIWLENQDHCS